MKEINGALKEIDGLAKSIRHLLGGGARFAIDYYQREYRWETKQVTELIDDLAGKFVDSYEKGHERSAVDKYGHYFLGSIIISAKRGQKFIIDGQQRITTLTLLLIHLYHKLTDDQQKGQIAELIFSQKYGARSFNLEVSEREACMDAIFKGEPFNEEGQAESVANILGRFHDIEDYYPDELAGEALPYFADWLIENVYLVEITAYSDANAYTIFETMNDRGLPLTPTEMLNGYLLTNITDAARRDSASRVWKARITALQELGKDEDADAIKAWLRSQHANSIRERRRGAQPRDFERIATEFHRWVRDHEGDLSLTESAAFGRFIEDDFSFYSRWYERIRKAARALTSGLETIYFNGQANFTLQYPALLAPLQRTDSECQINRKLRIVGSYIDIMIARRIWNWRRTGYSTMQYAMFIVIQEIRGRSVPELADILVRRLEEENETFIDNDFRLGGMNRRQIHWLLARFTDYVETCSGHPSHYDEYSSSKYQIEHVWADKYERHMDEFDYPNDFADYRNRIGGLLLLPRTFNASYGDLEYAEKRKHYDSQNLLARSLHENAYERNPGFLRFREESGLAFQAHGEFKRRDLDARQALYRSLAERVWDPEVLRREAAV